MQSKNTNPKGKYNRVENFVKNEGITKQDQYIVNIKSLNIVIQSFL